MEPTLKRRAQSLAEMAQTLDRLGTRVTRAESIASYRARPTDIVITPYGKCGTTWLQQTFHTLRTRGDMAFDDISRVVPWIETSVALGLDLNAPQRAEPRGFKSHLAWDAVPRGARYVLSLRDPKDALLSMLRFMEGWFLEPGAVSVDEFASGWLNNEAEPGSYWHHLLSWWSQRDNPDVLLLSYADMCARPEHHIRRLARFCGIALDDDLLALTLAQSSMDFMLRHKDRFDDAMMRTLSEQRCQLPPGSDSSKVRHGGSGEHRDLLSMAMSSAIDATWQRVVTPATGLADFAALEMTLRGLGQDQPER